MSRNAQIIAELGDGCNDGGDLPGLLGRAARALEAADLALDQIEALADTRSEARNPMATVRTVLRGIGRLR